MAPTPNVSGSTTRRVLGDVSPNVRNAISSTAAFKSKPIAGSPLKRSFQPSIQGENGFTYLKRRKLSSDEFVDEFGGAEQDVRSVADLPRTTDMLAQGQQEETVGYSSSILIDQSTAEPRQDTGIMLALQAASPTEPNTPSETGEVQDLPIEQKSFSSLINYNPSSQKSDSSLHGVTKAEMIRLRLRVAMYKVRTNQTHIPFADLRIEPEAATPRAARRTTSEAVQEAVATLRRQAQQSPTPDSLGTIPRLAPGTTSQSGVFGGHSSGSSHGLNSPQPQHSPDRLPTAAAWTGTPLRHGLHLTGTPDRLRDIPEQELTSSVVRGRVAEGLLGLRNAN